MAQLVHANTHLTVAPTVAHGGVKTNVIPDRIELEVDIRTLPGQTPVDVSAFLDEALGDLRSEVEVTSTMQQDLPSVSPIDTPLWDALTRAAARVHPDAVCVPNLTTGGTDARFFRELGIPAYGFGLFSRRMTIDQYATMFHGDDERVDQDSLRLSTELWEAVARDLLA